MSEQRTEQTADQQLLDDAARYRWIKENTWIVNNEPRIWGIKTPRLQGDDRFDSQVDAAIGESK